MKIIIAGSRDFTDYEIVRKQCDDFLSDISEIEIVSGRCSSGKHTFTTCEGIKVYGADGLGEKYAEVKGYNVIPFPANWKNYGKKAGPIRNEHMAEYADVLIAFWDLKSKGTLNMIELAKRYWLSVKIVKI